MPIYEYKCDQCGHQLEAFQKLSEPLLVQCPACRQDSLRKKVSAAGFRLKGGGWYETDFKSGSKKNVAATEDKSGAASKDDAGGKAEAKPDKSTADKASGGSEKSANTSSSGGGD